MRKSLLVGGVCLLALVLALPAYAQAGQNEDRIHTCSLDVRLTDDFGVFANMFLNLVLRFDFENSTSDVFYYDVLGNGYYELPTGERGRAVILTGRFSSKASDPRRVLEAQIVSGPLQGDTYLLLINGLSGNAVTSGAWSMDPPGATGLLSGYTTCTIDVIGP